MTLPGMTYGAARSYLGSTLTLTGTLSDINAMLRNAFFYSPYGISGAVQLTAAVTDHPRLCNSLLSGSLAGMQFAHGNALGGMHHLTQPSNFYQGLT